MCMKKIWMVMLFGINVANGKIETMFMLKHMKPICRNIMLETIYFRQHLK